MEDIYKQTTNMLTNKEFLSAYREQPTSSDPAFKDLLVELGYNFERDKEGNLVNARVKPTENLPHLISVLDSYRHAVASAVTSNRYTGPGAMVLGVANEGKDVYDFLKKTKSTKGMSKVLGESWNDMYNNKVGRRFSGAKPDAMKAINKAFIEQLKKMDQDGPNFEFTENKDFKFIDQNY